MLRRSTRSFSVCSRRELQKAKVLYLGTLKLPKTGFLPKIPKDSHRTDLIERSGKTLYQWQQNRPESKGEFTFHDGPPYANGDLHLGHSLNKILKDIVNRFELLYNGRKINYRPGWDCHGLPIEMKAIQNAGRLTAAETRQKCRELASLMIDNQRQQFLDFGVMTDFDTPYVTMSHDYETAQLRIFLKLFENGLLSRQLKPVWWGCETQTALAEAELEYNPKHKSVAIHVKYPLGGPLAEKLGGNAWLLIWTSTPWTIPANKAICINRDLTYTVLEGKNGEKVIVGVDVADSVCTLDPDYVRTSTIIAGSDLEGLHYTSPASGEEKTYPVIHGDHVTGTAGTGLVHNAPAHGMEDFVVGKKHKLEVASSVDGKGAYIQQNIPKGFHELAGRYAPGKDSIKRCLAVLEAHKMLFHVDPAYTHSYPYDWRLKTPVVQRATPQWFVNVEKIKDAAVELLLAVEFVPEAGRTRLTLFVRNRNEWCISRQRVWGVPLPILYHKETHEPLADLDTVRYVVGRLGEYGTDRWFEDESNISHWVPQHINSENYYKGRDTMDVWFDLGTSWSTLGSDLDTLMASDSPLADVYLEGSDQHRGWFQLSLLNKIIASGSADGATSTFKAVAPYKKIITHGFILDKRMDKMSKSKGNVISPDHVISGGGKPAVPALGTDGLRLWVASSNYTLDVSVSNEVLTRVLENVRKLRVTFKYMLGNLADYEAPVEYNDLSALDRWVLSRLHALQASVVDAYKTHNYARVVREINSHMSSDLSALYFDISKDCLYTSAADSARRRGIQTVLDTLTRAYIGMLAPIQPLLTQEVWDEYTGKSTGRISGLASEVDSPFKMDWSYYALPDEYADPAIEEEFTHIWAIRDALYKELETLKGEGLYKNKLEAEVFLESDSSKTAELLARHADYLDDYFLVSRVIPGHSHGHTFTVLSEVHTVKVTVAASSSCKCPRCWKYVAPKEDQLCAKCADVVQST